MRETMGKTFGYPDTALHDAPVPRHTARPAPLSARPRYCCPHCGRTMALGGWQRDHDYREHLAAHEFRARLRARLTTLHELPCALAACIRDGLGRWWAGLDSLHRQTWALAALLLLAGFVAATLVGGR